MSPVPYPIRSRDRESLSESARIQIQGAILDGTLHAGERLHDDRLIAWLGVSRTPIRTALDKLATVGLIEMAPNRFTRVAVPTRRLLADTVAVYGALSITALRAVLPELGSHDVAEFSDRASRLLEIARAGRHCGDADLDSGGVHEGGAVHEGDTVHDCGAHLDGDDLKTINDAVGFFARRLGNPALLAAVNDVETRLAFFFATLPVQMPSAILESFAHESRAAVEARDADRLAEALSVLLTRGGPTKKGTTRT